MNTSGHDHKIPKNGANSTCTVDKVPRSTMKESLDDSLDPRHEETEQTELGVSASQGEDTVQGSGIECEYLGGGRGTDGLKLESKGAEILPKGRNSAPGRNIAGDPNYEQVMLMSSEDNRWNDLLETSRADLEGDNNVGIKEQSRAKSEISDIDSVELGLNEERHGLLGIRLGDGYEQDLNVQFYDSQTQQSLSHPTTSSTYNGRNSVSSGLELEVLALPDHETNLESNRPVSPNTQTQSIPHVSRDVSFGQIDLLSPWFPEVDPEHKRAKGWRTWHSRREMMLWTAFLSACTVLLTNIIFLIVVAAKYGSWGDRGIISLHEGDCTMISRYGTIAHLCINILSTLLLGASNLCMQLLVAPTRNEMDWAHRRRTWLDIGVPSWRNLKAISRGRRTLWVCLGLSSIPLHFIYNSAISTSIPQFGYAIVTASESFLHGAAIGNWADFSTNSPDVPGSAPWPPVDVWNNTQTFMDMQANASNPFVFQNMTKADCFHKYTNPFAARTSLIIITEDRTGDSNASVHQYVFWPAVFGGYSHYALCYQRQNEIRCDQYPGPNCCTPMKNGEAEFDNWAKFDRKVLYCLSEYEKTGHCRINFSPGIFLIVCIFSAIKCVCICATLKKHKQKTLCTIGDAVASFLETPDPVSAHMAAVPKSDFNKSSSKLWTEPRKRIWNPATFRWYSGPSIRRWLITMLLCLATIVGALASVIPGSQGTLKRNLGKTFAVQMRQGLAIPDPDMFTGYFWPRYGWKGFIANVIWANIWQVIASLLYLAYNALLTCMLVSDEWSGFATERKTLRVSHPRGIQRSSYFVSMPLKWGILVMVTNTALHWLISQSMFAVSTIAYLPNYAEDPENSYTVTGYSISGSVVSICVGSFMLLVLVVISFRKVPNGIPLVSTCSIAISAACHPPKEDVDASLLPVQWGVVAENSHAVKCAFTTFRDVRTLRTNEVVQGEKETCDVDWEDMESSWLTNVWRRGWTLKRGLKRRKTE